MLVVPPHAESIAKLEPQIISESKSNECHAFNTKQIIHRDEIGTTPPRSTVTMPLFMSNGRPFAVVKFSLTDTGDQRQRRKTLEVIQDALQALAAAMHDIASLIPVVTPPPESLVLSLSPPEQPRQPPNRKPVFVAHQFDSEITESLRDALEEINKQDAMITENIFYDYQYADNKVQGFVFDTIVKSICKTKFSIFDVTHLNVNVMLEAGMAIGFNRPHLLLRKDTRVDQPGQRASFPQLLQGLHRSDFAGYNEIVHLHTKFRDTLRDAEDHETDDSYDHLFGELKPNCPSPQPKNPYVLILEHDEAEVHKRNGVTEFCKRVRSIASQCGLETLSCLDIGNQYHAYVDCNHPKNDRILIQWRHAVICAAAVVARIEGGNDNLSPSVGDCFIGAGIAHALQNPKNIIWTFHQPDRSLAEPPADFKAHSPLLWTKVSAFSTQLRQRFIGRTTNPLTPKAT
jgi:hypothetical protein